MEVIQISVFAVVSVILAVTVKNQRPEIAIAISVAAGTSILVVISKYLKSLFTLLNEIAAKTDLDFSFIEIILKIVAIAYICEFSSQICKDSGENAIAAKVELAGKVLILFTSSPIIYALLNLLTEIV